MNYVSYIHKENNQSNTTGATSGAGIVYHSGTPDFTPIFSWSIFSFLCSVLQIVILVIVLSVLSGF